LENSKSKKDLSDGCGILLEKRSSRGRKVEAKKRSEASYMKLTFATLKPLLRGRRKTEMDVVK
jgi:hypothetical protein